MLIVGRGGLMSSLDIPRLLVPLETRVGSIDLQIALKKALVGRVFREVGFDAVDVAFRDGFDDGVFCAARSRRLRW